MLKALLKKQIFEAFSWLYFDAKKGVRRSRSGIALFSLIYILVFGFLGVVFFGLSYTLCPALSAQGYGWLYFLIISIIALMLGTLGSVFNTYTSLYGGKDNDMLLSMPIPVRGIMLSRLCGVYLMGLMYELIVMLPALIVWFIFGSYNGLGAVFSIILVFLISLFVLTLSCILGWVVAVVAKRIKNKSFITVILSLLFFGAYYYACFNAQEYINKILTSPEIFANGVKGSFYVLYSLGRAAEGDALSMAIVSAIVLVCFALVYFVLCRTFISLSTRSAKEKSREYRSAEVRSGGSFSALYKRELKRFGGNANYMMNCGLGAVFALLLAVLMVFKGGELKELVEAMLPIKDVTPLLVMIIIATIGAMTTISAPSISLEGNTLWLLQALPIAPRTIILAKLLLHITISAIPLAIFAVCAVFSLGLKIYWTAILLAFVALSVTFEAMLGISLDLRSPNLHWTNENVPIKQSLGVMLSLFSGLMLTLVGGAGYMLFGRFIPSALYAVLFIVTLLAVDALLARWLSKRGGEIFKGL